MAAKVWLNSESTLVCSKDDVRQVTLEGEAYFEVKKDKEHCFEVHTSYGTVRVYGTSFNVRGRSRDSLFVVSLVEGSVGLQLDGSDKEIKLHPDEMACYDPKQDRLQLVEKDLSAAGLWRQCRPEAGRCRYSYFMESDGRLVQHEFPCQEHARKETLI